MIETKEESGRSTKGLLIVVLAMLPVLACGAWLLIGNGAAELPKIELTEQQRTDLIDRMKQMEIKPKDGVGPIRLGMKPDEVIAVVGPPEHRKDDYPTTLHYRKLGLYLVFGMEDNELGSIVCMSNTGETMSSRHDKPPLTFAGATKDGIQVGSDFADVTAKWGTSDLTVTHANFYGPGKVSKHAFYGYQVWVAEKEGRVIEISLDQSGWTKAVADNDK